MWQEEAQEVLMCMLLYYLYTLYRILSSHLCDEWSPEYINPWALMAKSRYDWSALRSVCKQLSLCSLGSASRLPSGTLCKELQVIAYLWGGCVVMGSVCACVCRCGDLEAMEDFIAVGKDVNAADPDGRTPLHYAVAYNQQDVLRALIDASANLESEDNKQNTPLHYACGYGRGECVETLIDAGANTGATNSSGKNGLDLVK